MTPVKLFRRPLLDLTRVLPLKSYIPARIWDPTLHNISTTKHQHPVCHIMGQMNMVGIKEPDLASQETSAVDTTTSTLDSLLAELRAEVAESARRREEQDRVLAEQDRDIADLQRNMAESDCHLANLRAGTASLEREIAWFDRTEAGFWNSVAQGDQQVNVLDGEHRSDARAQSVSKAEQREQSRQ
ncbi:hypothetical protein LTS10_012231 [Elasticomyces elasticus]|nr:hypothetical protein LTS10_012231 [Elasticomyces elasticus]